MPKKTYKLGEDDIKELIVSWDQGLKNLSINYQNYEVINLETTAELRKGKMIELFDNNMLSVKLKRNYFKFGLEELELLYNGKPLEGSQTDPLRTIKEIFSVILIIGIANASLGMLAEFFDITFLKSNGFNLFSVLFGILLFILAIYIHKIPIITISICLLLFIANSYINLFHLSVNNLGMYVIYSFFFIWLINGLLAAIKLHKIQNKIKE